MTNIDCTADKNFTSNEVAELLGKEVKFLSDKPLIIGGVNISNRLGRPCFEWKKGDIATIFQAESWENKITLNLVNIDEDIIEIDKQSFLSSIEVLES